ncbi:MAG: hypothetical protein R3F13_06495 [Prosthecobacter sp.]
MKSKSIITLLAALALAPLASADTEIRLTGSTAFRSAVHNALFNSFFTGPPDFAHSGTAGNYSGASKSIWRGTVSGISGTTTVRATWSGSATGISSVTSGSVVSFLTTATVAGSGENAGATASEDLTAHAAFSDVGQASTAFTSPTLTDNPVGVVAFTWVVNDTAATGATVKERYGFDNITAQFVRALYSSGFQQKSMLTGNPAHTDLVFAMGRDTGSGTRITMLVETKYGAFTPVQQFSATASGDDITELRLWPVAPFSGGDALAGNGGYSSGGTLRGFLANKTDSSFNLLDADGNLITALTNCSMISSIGISDSNTVVSGGGARLGYEGVHYEGTVDDAMIQEGAYTLWGYQHLLNATLDSDQTTARDALITAVDANVGSAGLALSSMNVVRAEDGGVVGP